MKSLAIVIATFAASLMLTALPAFSAEEITEQPGQAQQKDECLLLAKNCPTEVYSIQDRINALQREIGRGTAVYTQEELNILNQKLNDAYSEYSEMIEGG